VTLATRALLLALAAAGTGACHRAQAARLPAPPVALEIPPPPARVILPVTLAAYEPPPPPEPPPPAPAPSRPAANAKPTDKPAPSPTPPPAADAPAPVLQTTANANASEQKVLALLSAANADLNRIPYNQLSPVGKDQYQQARSFMQLAYDSLKIKNYNFAEYLADKAAVVAGMLVKR
jgi:hypothetical protein